MVVGLDKFREKFRKYSGQYVIIGGTACDSNFNAKKMRFRATKDIDLVIIIEALTVEFAEEFWNFVKEAEYEHLNRSTGRPQFYRFSKPKKEGFPFMIELFSRRPDFSLSDMEGVLTPIPVDDDISSLSAIVLNDSYYDFMCKGRVLIDDISVLNTPCLIVFKAKAWMDLSEKKNRGMDVDSTSIKKHKNDVFRLATLLKEDVHQSLPPEIESDMKLFFREIEKEQIDLRSLGIRNTKEQLIDLLKSCFSI